MIRGRRIGRPLSRLRLFVGFLVLFLGALWRGNVRGDDPTDAAACQEDRRTTLRVS